MHQARTRFDQLGNLQTALVLTASLVLMLGASVGLLASSAVLMPAASASPADVTSPTPAAPRISVPAAQPSPPVVHARAVTIAPSVYLRSEPTTASESLALLPRRTGVDLLGDDEVEGAAVWRHVRTDDDREGWIIGTALVLEAD
jgi:hypothetical protein